MTQASPPRRFSRFTIVSALAAAVLVLAGCSTSHQGTGPSSGPTSSEAGANGVTGPAGVIPDGFDEVYGQSVDWSSCGGGAFTCTTIQAPLDWKDPKSDTIGIAVQMYQARSGDPKGTIVINPGGPGASGIDLVTYVPSFFGEDLLDNYNILGFDPRGVAQSAPVKCFEPEEMDRYLAMSFDTDNPDALKLMKKQAAEFGEACKTNSGPSLEFVDTQSSARDMDLIRAVVGDEKFNYLGFSYGTQLGATYAGIFPKNVGKMVLDGAIDLRLTGFDQSLQQAVGFENALTAFVEDCLAGGDCPLSGDKDSAKQQVKAMLDSLATNPLPTSDAGRVLTQSLAFYGVAQPLYAEALWGQLTDALDGAINRQDGSGLLALSDSYFGRNPDGTYADNQTEAFTAINCLDAREDDDPAVMEKEAKKIVAAAPVMGEYFTYGAIACAQWPFPQVKQDFDLAAEGAAPIMVIGTTNDPATPYVWAQGLTEQLDSAFLVTHVGEGHTAYGMGSQCIMDTVGEYFVDGKIPADDPRCDA